VTRILYWNIEHFSSNKIDPATAETPLLAQLAIDRRELIGSIFARSGPGLVPQPPDIFVIVEVSAHTDPVILEGQALEPARAGGQGVRLLLDTIRNTFGAQWSLVPPLLLGKMGYREAVAVFYDALKLQFAGPYVWCQPTPADETMARPAVQPNLSNLRAYDPRWTGCLPGGRDWEVGGVKVPETQGAGQWEFEKAGGGRLYFPGWDNRSPFYTRFVDLHGGPNGGARALKLFSVHTSPASSVQAVNRLAEIQELQPAANEVSVIVGDFNVDTFDMDVNGAYANLVEDVGHGAGQGFTLLLDSRDQNVVNTNRRPYCMTHLLPLQQATPWNASGGAGVNHNVYPRFGYMGSVVPGGALSEAGAIDNALVRYGGGGAAPAHGASVVNPVVGTPYNQAPAPPGVTANLTNGAPYPSSMGTGIPQPGGINPPFDPGNFYGWNNYGKIRNTSDHLPLYVEI
jgi:hypothetical protein